MGIKTILSFRDLLARAESHELFFLKSLHGFVTPPSTFTTQEYRSNTNSKGCGRSNNSDHGGGLGG